MTATPVVIDLIGEIALLLWGIHMVHSGILRAYGSNLRHLLGRGLKTRFHAVLAGLGVTAVLQSSTATALMATSFTGAGVVGLAPALALMLGANIGTTLIVQVLSFDITMVFPVMIVVGLIAFRRGRGRLRDLGRVAIGLGLMLLSLHLLAATMAPVEHSPALQELLVLITRDPLLNLVLAAALTWAAHSSVAAMLFIMSLAATGTVPPDAALAMVLGANLGSAINPVLEGTGGDPVKLRLPLGNLLNRLVGCAIALPLLDPAAALLARVDADPARLAVNFHTAFNLALALLFILPLPWLARLLQRLLPARIVATDPGMPHYLDREALDMPSVALANAAREVLRMVDVTESMLRGSHDVFHADDRRRVTEISRMDDILDRLNAAIHRYLAAINREALSDREARRLSETLALAINLEHIGDIIDKNLMELAAKRIRQKLALSPDGLAEIDAMHDRLSDHLHLAVAVFMQGDGRSARRLVAEKEQFRDLERIATERHFARVQASEGASLESTALVLDIVRDLKRIDAHIAATAYPLLEQTGVLKSSRLAT